MSDGTFSPASHSNTAIRAARLSRCRCGEPLSYRVDPDNPPEVLPGWRGSFRVAYPCARCGETNIRAEGDIRRHARTIGASMAVDILADFDFLRRAAVEEVRSLQRVKADTVTGAVAKAMGISAAARTAAALGEAVLKAGGVTVDRKEITITEAQEDPEEMREIMAEVVNEIRIAARAEVALPGPTSSAEVVDAEVVPARKAPRRRKPRSV